MQDEQFGEGRIADARLEFEDAHLARGVVVAGQCINDVFGGDVGVFHGGGGAARCAGDGELRGQDRRRLLLCMAYDIKERSGRRSGASSIDQQLMLFFRQRDEKTRRMDDRGSQREMICSRCEARWLMGRLRWFV